MNKKIFIKNATLINEGKEFKRNILIEDKLISKITDDDNFDSDLVIDAKGFHLIPGIIDDQVHFREPGFSDKGTILSESIAAVAGGVTSYMEMPNTFPPAISDLQLKYKMKIANEKSLANYSFYIGANNTNIKQIMQCDPRKTCGVKVFMGSSTGTLLVDNLNSLHSIFKNSPLLIVTHCEDEATIKKNLNSYIQQYGDKISFQDHGLIRSEEACYKSSSLACELAEKYQSQLHVLHISTKKEISLFKKELPLKEKNITAEVCPQHLWFSDLDYAEKKGFIKCNPSIKRLEDRNALRTALIEDYLDIIGSDHAPHTLAEKNNYYPSCPSGIPMVGHSLLLMLELFHDKHISLPKLITKMSHNIADRFKISKRGYIKEGYFADLVLIDLSSQKNKIPNRYKCSWSPFDNFQFRSKVIKTLINGKIVYDKGHVCTKFKGDMLEFER